MREINSVNVCCFYSADEDRQVKKKKGIRAFFRGLWKRMICSSGIPKED